MYACEKREIQYDNQNIGHTEERRIQTIHLQLRKKQLNNSSVRSSSNLIDLMHLKRALHCIT